MWTSRSEKLANGAIKFEIDLDSTPVTYGEVLRRWQNDADFRTLFNGLLSDSPFSAFRWETPPITSATTNRRFEFVLLNSPGLERAPDVDAFAEHFRGVPDGGVAEFLNLGKDAIMVVPCPSGPLTAYNHLAAFVRHAPSRSDTNCGNWSVQLRNADLAPSQFGSAQQVLVSPGCIFGSMIGPSTMAMHHIGMPSNRPATAAPALRALLLSSTNFPNFNAANCCGSIG